jgi:hypothetical protein
MKCDCSAAMDSSLFRGFPGYLISVRQYKERMKRITQTLIKLFSHASKLSKPSAIPTAIDWPDFDD